MKVKLAEETGVTQFGKIPPATTFVLKGRDRVFFKAIDRASISLADGGTAAFPDSEQVEEVVAESVLGGGAGGFGQIVFVKGTARGGAYFDPPSSPPGTIERRIEDKIELLGKHIAELTAENANLRAHNGDLERVRQDQEVMISQETNKRIELVKRLKEAIGWGISSAPEAQILAEVSQLFLSKTQERAFREEVLSVIQKYGWILWRPASTITNSEFITLLDKALKYKPKRK